MPSTDFHILSKFNQFEHNYGGLTRTMATYEFFGEVDSFCSGRRIWSNLSGSGVMQHGKKPSTVI